MTTLSCTEIDDIISSFIDCNEVKLPARLSQTPVTIADKRQYLLALLQHDPGVFLERHGRLLTVEQRSYFQPLAMDSYEVDFYLKLLEDEQRMDTEQQGPPSSTAKNRRLAKMTRLAKEGYFDEEVARKRAPLLHYHYIGQHGTNEQCKPRANSLHDQIIQQHEEQQLKAVMAAQQREEEAAREAFEATLSESETEGDSDDGDDIHIAPKEVASTQETRVPLSEQELQQNHEDFKALMEARFLDGEDGGREADQDSSLDDDWAREQTQDIEDKYFET